jgi:predicted AAA+ superfamily ATPase
MAWSFVIDRQRWARAIRTGLRRNPVVALVGPRQCGKTTLARQVVSPSSPSYFDLEDPTSLERLAEPLTALSGLRGVIVIDEVQRRPRLTPSMRVALDDLKLDRIVVLYPGNVAYRLSEGVEVVPVTALASATPAALLGHAPKRRRSTARS